MSRAAPSDREPIAVLLAAATLVPGGMGGSEKYVRALLDALSDRADLEVSFLTNRAAAPTMTGPGVVVADRLAGGGTTLDRLRTLALSRWPGADARRALAAADVVHYPLTVPVPARHARPSVPRVVTLLDVQHLDLPELFSSAERLYRRRFYDRAVRRAGAVITISEFCRSQIVSRLGVPAARVHVAPLGVDADRFRPGVGERGRFVLYPARGWPHKNHRRLVEAVALLRREQPDLRLVLTGGGGPPVPDAPDWVEHRGLVSEQELAELYRTAACLAYPTLYEGFGLPPLEALASGCPVAASDVGPIPELVEGFAELFDPLDVSAIADGIRAAMAAPPDAAARGVEHASRFTWKACADTHAAVYQAACGR